MFEIRTITNEDVHLFRSRLARGFGKDADEDQASADRFEAIFDYDRTFAAFDGDDIVGTGGNFSLGVTVPGGANVAMGGVTVITVQPTHRRRGILRSLMGHLLDDVAARGEPLAGLWASEGSIYGRFGFGPATYRYVASVDAGVVQFSTDRPKGSTRLLDSVDAGPVIRGVYEKARPLRAGMLTRSDAWWAHRLLADPESWREGKTSNRHVVFEEDGAVTGYARYRQKDDWDDFVSKGNIDITELIANTTSAHAALWSFLTNIDLFPRLEWWNMPVDDTLPLKVTNERHVQRKLSDALWLRIMDLPAALGAREYGHDGVVTFALRDASRPENEGTYRLEVADGLGTCERISTTAELSFEADVLGRLFLGGGDALALSAAGRIEGDRSAVMTLHRMFRTERAPWCPEVF